MNGETPTRRKRLLPGLSLRTWLLGSHLLVLVLPLLALIFTGALAMDLREQTHRELEHQADVLSVLVGDLLREQIAGGEGAGIERLGPRLDPLLIEVRERTLASVRLLDERGVVIATSGSGEGEDLAGDPEVATALTGETGKAVRPRPPASERQPIDSESRRADVRLFVAEPIFDPDGQVAGVVLLSRTPREELQALYHMSPRLSLGLALALAITIVLAISSGRLGTRSLARLAEAARRIARGSGSESKTLLHSAGSHVDEVRELARAVAAMAEQLEARVAYINEFAGNVAHEFRTPIATFRGTAELLRDDDDMDPDQRRRFLDNVLDELERLERLVDGLLELARAERPHTSERIELTTLLGSLRQRWPEVCVVGLDHAGVVQGSPSQLATVLDNLIDNAYQHGGPGVQVEVHALELGHPAVSDRLQVVEALREWTGFEVRDDGVGISAANRERVFERFFTTNREGGGTGLGLALVRRIVETHGGRIELDSRPGGTRIRIWLPHASE